MKRSFRPPYKLLAVALFFLVLGLAVHPITSEPPAKVTATTVLITGIPFLLVFISILLTYIAIIVTLSRYYSGRLPEKRFNPIFYACMAGIVLGIVMMFQAFLRTLYTAGFLILLFSLLTFIAVSHITPRKELSHPSQE